MDPLEYEKNLKRYGWALVGPVQLLAQMAADGDIEGIIWFAKTVEGVLNHALELAQEARQRGEPQEISAGTVYTSQQTPVLN